MSRVNQLLVIALALTLMTGAASAQAFNNAPPMGSLNQASLNIFAPTVFANDPVIVTVNTNPGACVTLIVSNGPLLTQGSAIDLGSLGLLLINPSPAFPNVTIDTSIKGCADVNGVATFNFVMPPTNPTNEDAIIVQACAANPQTGMEVLSNLSGILIQY